MYNSKLHRVVEAFCISFWQRSGYHAAALPFELRGVGGPGAPHYFYFVRRAESGQANSFPLFVDSRRLILFFVQDLQKGAVSTVPFQ